MGLSIILGNPNRHVISSAGLCLDYRCRFLRVVLGCKASWRHRLFASLGGLAAGSALWSCRLCRVRLDSYVTRLCNTRDLFPLTSSSATVSHLPCYVGSPVIHGGMAGPLPGLPLEGVRDAEVHPRGGGPDSRFGYCPRRRGPLPERRQEVRPQATSHTSRRGSGFAARNRFTATPPAKRGTVYAARTGIGDPDCGSHEQAGSPTDRQCRLGEQTGDPRGRGLQSFTAIPGGQSRNGPQGDHGALHRERPDRPVPHRDQGRRRRERSRYGHQ